MSVVGKLGTSSVVAAKPLLYHFNSLESRIQHVWMLNNESIVIVNL